MSFGGLAADLLKSGMDAVKSGVDRVTTALTTSGVMNLQPGTFGPGGEEAVGVGGGGSAGGTTSISNVDDLPLLAAFEAYRSEEGNELRMKLEDRCVIFNGKYVKPAGTMNVQQDPEHEEGFLFVPLPYIDGTWVECVVQRKSASRGDSGDSNSEGEGEGEGKGVDSGVEDEHGVQLRYIIRAESAGGEDETDDWEGDGDGDWMYADDGEDDGNGEDDDEEDGFKTVARARILRVGTGEGGSPVQMHKGVLTLSSSSKAVSVRADGPFSPVYDEEGDDPEVVTGFTNGYFMDAGLTVLMDDEDLAIPGADGFIALKVGTTTATAGDASLECYEFLGDLQEAQQDPATFIVPLYVVEGSKITLDLRNIPHIYRSEVLT